MIVGPIRAWLFGAAMALLLGACGDAENDATSTSSSISTPSTLESALGNPSTTSTTTAGTTIQMEIVNGKVTTANKRPVIKRGDEVRLEIRSDVTDEVHVHGYDLSVPVSPGQPAELTFAATIPGVFEIELEHNSKRLIEIEVSG